MSGPVQIAAASPRIPGAEQRLGEAVEVLSARACLQSSQRTSRLSESFQHDVLLEMGGILLAHRVFRRTWAAILAALLIAYAVHQGSTQSYAAASRTMSGVSRRSGPNLMASMSTRTARLPPNAFPIQHLGTADAQL